MKLQAKTCNFMKKSLWHWCFPVEFTKFLNFKSLKVCERLLRIHVLSLGLPFLITDTPGSNWYICFTFCIIIYSFVCQFSLHYYRCYNQKQSSGGVLQKRRFSEFWKFTRTYLRWSLIFNEAAGLQSLILSNVFLWIMQISQNTFLKERFGRLLLHKHSLCLLSYHDLFLPFSGWVFSRLSWKTDKKSEPNI